MINWKLRLQNKFFWLTAIPAFLLVLQAAAAVFGYHLDLGDIGNKLILLVNAVFVFLTAIGLVNDPTTSGITDSTRALEMIQFFIDKANAGDGVDNDGAYGFQCADVPCYGLRHWYGVTLWGNAYDLLESARSQGLKVVYDADYPKAGWFFVKSYVAGDGVNYGHTGLVYEDSDGSTIKTIEQNIDGTTWK